MNLAFQLSTLGGMIQHDNINYDDNILFRFDL